MTRMKFYICDVFARRKYSGNQLAVFMDAGKLSAGEMQAIAREINFSESVFIRSGLQKNGGFDARIFTPGEEVDFAGHPTLGTAHIIHRHLLNGQGAEVRLNLKAGQIPVVIEHGEGDVPVLWMTQNYPTFGARLKINEVTEMLGLDAADIDENWPIEEVSTGLSHLIIPLKSMAALKKSRLNADAYFRVIAGIASKSVLIFCPEGYEDGQHIGVRVYDGYYGIPEDPATGSGNGCLAGYLLKHGYFPGEQIDLTAGQGYELNRPSTLYLKAWKTDAGILIKVGGSVIPIAEGDWQSAGE